MHFVWPQALWALLLAPLLLAFYLWLLRRKQRSALAYPSLALVRTAMGPRKLWRRHVPPALLGLALISAVVGMARPVASVVLPADYMTLVLAIDVSRSMLAEDVEPNRIKAAQAAVKDFIRELPPSIRVGVVSFAGAAQLVQGITDQRDELVASIDRFQLQRGTATGSGLLMALSTLLPNAGIDLEAAIYGQGFGGYAKALTINGRRALAATQTTAVPHPLPPPHPKPSPVLPQCLRAPTRRVRLCCSPMVAAPRAPTPSRRPSKPPSAGCASTPWPLARPMVLFQALKARLFMPRWTKKPCKRSPKPPRGSFSVRAIPTT